MSQQKTIAIVGATGVSGAEIVNSLGDRKLEGVEYALYASAESAGELYSVAGNECEVHELRAGSLSNCDIVILAVRPDIARDAITQIGDGACTVIDLSGSSRALRPSVIGAQVNLQKLSRTSRVVLIAHPLSVVLAELVLALKEIAPVTRMVVSTYQSVSGAGAAALEELYGQTLGIFNQKEQEPEVMMHQIAFNCIPQIDLIGENGESLEERRIEADLSGILGADAPKVSITCVRVPVFHGDALSVYLEFSSAVALEKARAALEHRPGVVVAPVEGEHPMHISVVGTSELHIGRLRTVPGSTSALSCWVVIDSLKRGIGEAVADTVEALLAG